MMRTIEDQAASVLAKPGPNRRESAHQAREAAAASATTRDTVEVSAETRRRVDEPVRTELVERIREQLAQGAYLTPEKLDVAVERLQRALSEP
jgi:anti-sigma28 factor (negative regulator of flagellin synthesis)